MTEYRKIFLIVDPDMHESPAYHRAVEFARARGTQLYLCLFAYSGAIASASLVSSTVGESAKWGFIAQRERWLGECASRLRACNIDVRTDVIWGSPVHERILEKIVEWQPDLVIKDVHLEPLLKRVLFTPLDWHLLRLCPAPLLMVRSTRAKPSRRIVAAVDTSHPTVTAAGLNQRIAEAAASLASLCDARAEWVHCFEDFLPIVPGEVTNEAAFNQAFERLRRQQQQRFDDFADQYGVPPTRRHFIVGPSAQAIAAFARESRADVLVLGSSYRSGMDRIVLGGTVENILPDVRCDVMVVKPEGFMRDLERELHFLAPAPESAVSEPTSPLSLG